MARDLDLTQPHADAIHGVPIVREADGLAMSSRNAYLSPEQREAAAALPQAMREAIGLIAEGAPVSEALGNLHDTLISAGFQSVDYAEVRDADNLERLEADNGNARLFLAARMGGTRLIDNMPVS